jgi:hypothetical protein
MPKSPPKPKLYPVGIVGESNFQDAVKSTNLSDYVDIVIERENPHAENGVALRVDNMDGDTIGYVPADSWLRRAILEDGSGCLARVSGKAGRPVGIVIEVQLGPEEVPTVVYGDRTSQGSSKSGCFGIALLIPSVSYLAGQFFSGL